MLMNQKPGSKSIMKDIAALYFSAMDIGLSKEDFNFVFIFQEADHGYRRRTVTPSRSI
jgi:hypothetical protein